ncbi:MAG: 2-oxoacid:acceptor oxidoreductase subunit alpha [Firmicutes bacterium]|nr:2-oxoacid:acceptor oxidoreductase subunit alpha [Bacillota bacterium]
MTSTDFTWKVGGAQGEGIDSTGEIFALTLHRLGYYIYTYRHFMSVIKGGHTNYKVRVSPVQRRHRGDGLDLLVAFDQGSIDFSLPEMNPGSAIIYDSTAFDARVPAGRDMTLIPIPLTKMARDMGMVIMKNMVAIGASAALVGLPADAFEDYLQERFGKKGGQIVETNRQVLAAGYNYARSSTDWRHPLPELPAAGRGKKRLFLHGNDAVALGAVNAGCRVVAAYPITPATEILYSVLKLLPKYGGVVLQAEDEIAACQMAIGANYAGVRAMTSTSGPGLSLMAESLGLSGVSETPLVIVDVMRAGPSTGMPTKTEQADAFHAVYSAHGEIQRIVLAPATVEDAFYDMQRAFNLADKYQVPVIVLVDMVLGLSKQTVEVDDIDFDRIAIDRGKLLTAQADVDAVVARLGEYKRYELTEDGTSPRALPGLKNAVHMVLSYEHDEEGNEMEDREMRVKQTRKRFGKMQTLDVAEWALRRTGPENPDLLLVGWGSTDGQLEEAREELAKGGLKAAHLQVGALHPLPAAALRREIEAAGKVLVFENSYEGQLLQLIKQKVGHFGNVQAGLKFNGDPFYVHEVVAMAEELTAATKEVV